MYFDENDTLSTIATMRRQEVTCYQTTDFFDGLSVPTESLKIDIDEDCRTKMTAWCYQVVKFCKFGPESVEIAMNHLDRVCASAVTDTVLGRAALSDRNVYQLASMTCLYTAIKTNERQAMNPELVAMLSQGAYTPEQVEEMERSILSTLQWRVNPPTTLAFVREYISLLQQQQPQQSLLSKAEQDAVMEIVALQAEVAAMDRRFLSVPSSVVAFAALLNALDSIGYGDVARTEWEGVLTQTIGLAEKIDMYYLIQQVQSCLLTAISSSSMPSNSQRQQQQQQTNSSQHSHQSSSAAKRRTSFDESPRSVAAAAKAAAETETLVSATAQ